MGAASWAAAVPAGTPVRWRALEVAAFEGHPQVQQELDPAAKYGRVRSGSATRRGLALAAPLWILGFLLPVAPVFGYATLIGDRFGRSHPDPTRSIPAAGMLFAVSLPLLVVSFALWLRAGRPKDVLRQYQAGIALVLGALSAGVVADRGSAASVADWRLWNIPVLVVTVIGGVFSALLWVAGRAARVEKPSRAAVTAAYGVSAARAAARVAAEVGRLSDGQRAAVGADLAAALDDLTRRGVISAAHRDRALGAELGTLGPTMSQSPRRPGRAPTRVSPGRQQGGGPVTSTGLRPPPDA